MKKNMGNVSGVIVKENGNAKTQEEKTEETIKKKNLQTFVPYLSVRKELVVDPRV